MNLNWFESLIYGLVSGLTDIFPVSAQAHRAMMLKFFGVKNGMELQDLLVHLAIAGALYINCRKDLVRMNRARRLARIPKKKRKRPLDMRSMMDLSLLRTMLVPALVGLFLYRRGLALQKNLMVLALFIFINGIILYVPQYLPSGNRDSRTLSRVEGLLMGLGGIAGAVPGISSVGTAASVASVCGVDRKYGLSLVLMLQLFLSVGCGFLDLLGLMSAGLGTLSLLILLRYLFTAAAAFAGSMLAVRFMRHMAENDGYSVFAFYCFGLSLFTFIVNLVA